MLPSILGVRRHELTGTPGGTIVIVTRGKRDKKPGILIIKNDRNIDIQAAHNIHITSRSDYALQSDNTGLPLLKCHADTGPNDHLLARIHALLDTHMDDSLFSIEQLCKAIGMSRAQIYRKFSTLDGRTLHDYLRFYRLRRAKELLLTTNLNVSEAAYGTGFSNVSHFSRIFTEEFGQNPKDCKKKVVIPT